jgi:hypothetical protein
MFHSLSAATRMRCNVTRDTGECGESCRYSGECLYHRWGMPISPVGNAYITGKSFPPPPPPREKSKYLPTDCLPGQTDNGPSMHRAYGCHTHKEQPPIQSKKVRYFFFIFFSLSENGFYSPSKATRMCRSATRDHQEHRELPKSSGESPHPR